MRSKSQFFKLPNAVLMASVFMCATFSAKASLPQEVVVPSPQIFAPGVVSGPANDGSPTFSADGNTIFFSRNSVQTGGMILESHRVHGRWSHPTLASFSGEWPDSSPELSPDGSYIVFQSSRPVDAPEVGLAAGGVRKVSNIWRSERVGNGWSKPKRLPDTVNIGVRIWKPSVDAAGNIYFVSIDDKGAKRLYMSRYSHGEYEQAQPLPFSDGSTLDVDPEIAPDGSFLVFCSAGRLTGNSKDHLFVVKKTADGWSAVIPIRYAGDEKNGYSTDDEPHLGPDHHTIYFASDRAIPLAFPRSPRQAQQDFKQLERTGWFGVFANVWSLPISTWLDANQDTADAGSTKTQ
jgi:Tol biopolymer transport system component